MQDTEGRRGDEVIRRQGHFSLFASLALFQGQLHVNTNKYTNAHIREGRTVVRVLGGEGIKIIQYPMWK